MPRRRSSTESTDQSTDPKENPVTVTDESTSTEAPAEAAAEAPAEAKADKPEVKIDLTAFEAAVTESVTQRDESTGDLPEAAIAPVQAQYRSLDGLKAKNAARARLAELMKGAMNALDIQSARAFMVLTESLSAAGGTKQDKPPADPKAAFNERYSSLLLAVRLVAAEAPEGVDPASVEVTDEQVAQAQALIAHAASEAEDKGDAPESSAIVRSAVKLASGKASGSRKSGVGTGAGGGVRRDIGKHIESAFDGVDAGTFLTVAEIRTHKSAEYGDEPPSAGAISARLFPSSGKSTVTGVEPGTNDKGVRGATKNAA